MRYMVLGAGRQGRACSHDLLAQPETEAVVLVDAHAAALDAAAGSLAPERLRTVRADVGDADSVRRLAAEVDVVASCVPYRFNLGLARAAIAGGAHFLDLGGNTPIVLHELALDAEAAAAGVTVVPDCGLGPGLINTVAVAAMEGYEAVDEVAIYVGGLPQHPVPPLSYALFFSVEGLVNEYFGPGTALVDGRRVEVEGLSEVEEIDCPPPLGRCEAAHAAGGLSTMAWTFEGRVRTMFDKLIRFPGHIAAFHLLRDLGFFDGEPVELDGARITPRAVSSRLLERHLAGRDERDVVFLRVIVRGVREGRSEETTCEMTDLFDEATGLTAMARTTGFSAAIVARMLADGTIGVRGARPVEVAVPPAPFLAAAAERGFRFVWRRRELGAAPGEAEVATRG